MKKKSTSQSAFFNLRVLVAAVFCLVGVFVALISSGAFAQAKGNNRAIASPAFPGAQNPEVVRMVGPVRLDQDLRMLPYVAPKPEFEEQILTRYPHGNTQPGPSKVEALDQEYLASNADHAASVADI